MNLQRQERLPRPRSKEVTSNLWVDEAIWGHRLYDEQTPWLTLLEFLNVFAAEHEKGRALKEPADHQLLYGTRRRLHLRNILFNNPWLPWILANTKDESERWKIWLDKMRDNSTGIAEDERDFSYLRQQRFETFEDFASLVDLLRSTAIEGDSNKRWTSKFSFPYGPSCLFEDLRATDDGVTNDRRFFGRTGELVYLMLARSKHSETIRDRLSALLLNATTPWDKLVQRLQPPQRARNDAGAVQNSCYLPYAEHSDFDDFGRDLVTLLEAELPGYDVLPHLVDVIGLHLARYVLRRATEWVPNETNPTFVVEILAPKRTIVRDLAAASYDHNNRLSALAVQHFINEEVEKTSEWQRILASADPFGDAAQFIFERTAWAKMAEQGKNYDGPRDPSAVVRELHQEAQKRHSQHFQNIHGSYAKEIGLASKRNTRRYRYAPNDRLLKSLVLVTVPLRTEFQKFLQMLFDRYGLVIGDLQAETQIKGGGSDRQAFEENARRLEMRLSSLGLLHRLSDACAFVVNPYVEGGA